MRDRRSNIKHGEYSRAIVLPAKLRKGSTSTLAANRLVLIDPRGEISEDDLLDFLETYIEPKFWSWFQRRKEQDASEETCSKRRIHVSGNSLNDLVKPSRRRSGAL